MKFLDPEHPFIVAVRQVDLAMVRQLIDEDESLLEYQVRGDVGLTGKIWNDGKHINVSEDAPHHAGPLHFAAFHGHSELAQLLIDSGTDISALADFGEKDGRKFNALGLGAWQGDVATLEVLLKAAKASNLQLDLNPSLHSALAHADHEKAGLLLDYGAEHDICTAAQAGDHEILQRLIEELKAKDPDGLERDEWNYGRTPLEQALVVGQLKSAEILEANGASVSLRAATAMGRLDQVKTLLDSDKEAVTRRFGKYPLLCWAIFCGQVDVVEFLLDNGADPNGMDEWSVSPLRYCTSLDGENGAAIAKLLLNAGADVNQNARGMIPSEWAEQHPDNPIAQAIMQGNGDRD
ncbi:MAG: ankyrin repeat domain-containing protein [Planctomycetota bacterium]